MKHERRSDRGDPDPGWGGPSFEGEAANAHCGQPWSWRRRARAAEATCSRRIYLATSAADAVAVGAMITPSVSRVVRVRVLVSAYRETVKVIIISVCRLSLDGGTRFSEIIVSIKAWSIFEQEIRQFGVCFLFAWVMIRLRDRNLAQINGQRSGWC
jgi:hypothetical protein